MQFPVIRTNVKRNLWGLRTFNLLLNLSVAKTLINRLIFINYYCLDSSDYESVNSKLFQRKVSELQVHGSICLSIYQYRYIYIYIYAYIYIYYFNVIPYITIARSLFLDVACQIFFYGREGNKSLYYLPQTRKSDEWHSSGEHERREDLPDYRREQWTVRLGVDRTWCRV